MIRAVIIDFDDTLCLTEEACFGLENEALVRMGRSPQTRDMHKSTWGQPLFEAIKIRSPGVDVPEFRKLWIETHQAWLKEGRIDVVSPENLQTLDDLLDVGKELFILTTRTHDELRHILESDHGLAERVKTFYYRDNMDYHKPDPRAFDKLLHEHNLTPEECVYIGDSPSDAQAAKGAHMHFIACLEAGLRTKKDFSTLAVDAFIGRFTDLPVQLASDLFAVARAHPSVPRRRA